MLLFMVGVVIFAGIASHCIATAIEKGTKYEYEQAAVYWASGWVLIFAMVFGPIMFGEYFTH